MGDRWGAAFVRIGWQASFGLGGSFAPDWVAGITGIRSRIMSAQHEGVLTGASGRSGYGRKDIIRIVDDCATSKKAGYHRAKGKVMLQSAEDAVAAVEQRRIDALITS